MPKPQFEWAYDPCMPPEWNEVIAAMKEYEEPGVLKLTACTTMQLKMRSWNQRTFITQETQVAYPWIR